jgi:glycosyltransferase involved in cell wall biosynthesis
VYIPNGVHLSNFKLIDQGRDKQREQFGFIGFTIVYTGAHGPANALETIISAAAILHKKRSDIQFVLVGDGPSKDDLVENAKERGLTNIRFLDPVPKGMIPQLLSVADAAVITLRSVDAFSYAISPNKLFDYMAAGKPVICAVPGDVGRLVERNKAGLTVEPEDAIALAEAAECLRSMDNEERLAFGQRGRDLVMREFSREVIVNRLVEIL